MGEIFKGAVPYKPERKTKESRAWDGTAATKRLRVWAGGPDKDTINWSKYSRGFAWFDSDKKDTYTAYKLPHHDVIDGAIVTVWRGVRAAMAALLGARGGVQVTNRRDVYNHLAKHYRQYDREPPEFKDYSIDDLKQIFGKDILEEVSTMGDKLEEKKEALTEAAKEPEFASTGTFNITAESTTEAPATTNLAAENTPETEQKEADETKVEEKFYFDCAINKSDSDDEDDSLYIEGYAATSDLDRQYDVITLKALKKAAKALKQSTTVFFNHDTDRPVGRVDKVSVDDTGMLVRIFVSETEVVLRRKIQEGIVNKFSIGGRIKKWRPATDEEVEELTGKKIKDMPITIMIIEEIELFEISIVGLPANVQAGFTVHKSLYDALKEKRVSEEGQLGDSDATPEEEKTEESTTAENSEIQEGKEKSETENPTETEKEETESEETPQEDGLSELKTAVDDLAKQLTEAVSKITETLDLLAELNGKVKEIEVVSDKSTPVLTRERETKTEPSADEKFLSALTK